MRQSRFTKAVQAFYILVVSSVMFWINIVFGCFIFGISYSFDKSFNYTKNNSYYDKYKETCSGIKQKYEKSNLLVVFFTGCCFLSIKYTHTITGALSFFASYFYLILVLSYIIFKSYYKLSDFRTTICKMKLELSLELSLISLLIFMSFIFVWNKLIFIVFGPGILFKITDLLLKKKKNQVNYVNNN